MNISSQKADTWIRCFHPSDAAVARLVCFPHAGGSATYYFPLSRATPPWLDVVAVQYPGRQDRRTEPCVEDLHELADRVFEAVRGWTDLPFALFGHSLGASLGFEVGMRLEKDGRPPLALFASGRRAPSRHRNERVHEQDDAGIIAELKRLAGTDTRMLGEEDVLRMILPSLRGDYKAAETYRGRPGDRLTAPITALTGTDDPQVTLEEANAWAGHTSSAFTLRTYPGGHFFLNHHSPAIIEEILAVLNGSVSPRP